MPKLIPKRVHIASPTTTCLVGIFERSLIAGFYPALGRYTFSSRSRK